VRWHGNSRKGWRIEGKRGVAWAAIKVKMLPRRPSPCPLHMLPHHRPRTASGFLLCTKRDLLMRATSVEVWKTRGDREKDIGKESGMEMEET